jgi:hypothetical protein
LHKKAVGEVLQDLCIYSADRFHDGDEKRDQMFLQILGPSSLVFLVGALCSWCRAV